MKLHLQEMSESYTQEVSTHLLEDWNKKDISSYTARKGETSQGPSLYNYRWLKAKSGMRGAFLFIKNLF